LESDAAVGTVILVTSFNGSITVQRNATNFQHMKKLYPIVEQGGMAPDGAGGYLEMAARTDLGG
jgi:hypothetical protein